MRDDSKSVQIHFKIHFQICETVTQNNDVEGFWIYNKYYNKFMRLEHQPSRSYMTEKLMLFA